MGPLLPRLRLPLLLAAMCVLGVVLWLRPTPEWWFGGALIAAALAVAGRAHGEALATRLSPLSRPRTVLGLSVTPSRVGLELLYVLGLTFVASVMMSELAWGHRPVSHDHTVHYFKAWQLNEHFLSEGRLLGWSHRWFAGYPAQYLYPIGADLWVNLVYALSFGTLSFSAAYGVAFWLFHVFTGLSAYRLGRMVGGPHVGAFAGLFILTDLSEFRMGGWAYTVEYGVWPQALSLSFSLMATCSLLGMARRSALTPIAAFALWSGAAIITHPAALIYMVFLAVAFAVAAGFAEGVRAPGAVLRLLLGCALSIMVAAVWLLPFLSSRSETSVMGVWWDTTYELAKGILDLDAFEGTLGWVLAGGIAGLFVTLRTRRLPLLFCALMALLIPAVCNSTFIDELHLTAVSGSFTKVQFLRMSIMAKPFWFVLAGYFAVALLRRGRQLAGDEPGAARRAESLARTGMITATVTLLVLPFGWQTAEAFWTRHVRKALTTEVDRPLVHDRERLEAWLRKHLPDPDDGFYRLGVFMGHNHDLLDLGASLDVPMYKRGFTPCSNFVYKMHERDPEILKAVNLRYAIIKKHLPSADWELLERFGRYRVFEFKHWRPEPFRIIEGDGEVKLERFEDEEIVFTAGPGSHGRIRLNVSYFSRFAAYRDGKPVPLGITYLREAPQETGFMTLELKPGRYRVVFERTLLDRLALPISLATVLTCLAVMLLERRRGVLAPARALQWAVERVDRTTTERWSAGRRVALALFCVALLSVGVVLSEWTPPIDTPGRPAFSIRRVRYDFLEELGSARAMIEYRGGRQPCLRLGERLVCRDEEGHLDNDRYVGSTPATIEEYTMVRCIRARPENRAVLSVQYPRVPMGDVLVGYYGIERAGRLLRLRRPVDFRVTVAGREVYQGRTRADNQMHYFNVPLQGRRGREPVTFSVRADNVRKRYFCFHAQVVDL
ncbi:MAG: hypothetical protein PVI30_07245 [Myxococcales bacterium]|jgi:hypothetical protein